MGARERRGRERFVREQPPYSMLVRGIEADVLPDLPALRHGRHRLEPARRRLAVAASGARAPDDAAATRAERLPAPLRPVDCPANQRKLDAADALAQLADEAGITLIQLALAFVISHPAVTVGDHRPAHDGAARVASSRAADVELDATTCSTASTRSSRPGANLNPADAGWQNPALAPDARRR